MARKSFCDRCNSEILGMPYTLNSGMKEQYDLCKECRLSFEDFIKGAVVGVVTTGETIL